MNPQVSALSSQASSLSRHSAFSLVEVTLALGIAGFCLLTIVGMLPVGLSSNKNSIQQSAAASLARAIAADLRTTPKTSNASPRYQIPFSTTTPSSTYFIEDGTPTHSPPSFGYLATITINTNSIPASVKIKITWPAAAPAATAPDAFELTTAIDRR